MVLKPFRVFVGDPKSDKPLIYAYGNRVEGECAELFVPAGVIRSSKKGRVFRTKDGRYEYTVHCWFEEWR